MNFMTLCKNWQNFLLQQRNLPYMKKLESELQNEYENHTIYPQQTDIYRALELTPVEKVRVVILGQDPYHSPNQAHGLAFSVLNGEKSPPSLRNIFLELQNDLLLPQPTTTDLSPWASQGVLLLNTTLTVREGVANSHSHLGWDLLTDEILRFLDANLTGVVFILWGSFAQKKARFLNPDKHFIINSPHPSPLSSYRGFFGSKPFSQTNDYLTKQGQPPIDWELE